MFDSFQYAARDLVECIESPRDCFITSDRQLENHLSQILYLARYASNAEDVCKCADTLRRSLAGKPNRSRRNKLSAELKAAILERECSEPVGHPAVNRPKPDPNLHLSFQSTTGETLSIEFSDLVNSWDRSNRDERRCWFADPSGLTEGEFLLCAANQAARMVGTAGPYAIDPVWILAYSRDDLAESFGLSMRRPECRNRELSGSEAEHWLARNGHEIPLQLRGRTLSSCRQPESTDQPIRLPTPTLPSQSGQVGRGKGGRPGAGDSGASAVDVLDESSVAEILLKSNRTIEAAVVRHFKGRIQTTHIELIEAVTPGEDRDWQTVKTWMNRTKNAIMEFCPRCNFSFRTTIRGYLITKVSHPR
jgi:hypothetical protein